DTTSVIEDAFEAVFVQAEGRALEQLLPAYSAALGTVILANQDAIAQLEALDPPDTFARDHRRAMQLLEEEVEAWGRQKAAADAGDGELIAQIDLELASLRRQARADLSAEFVESFEDPDSDNGTANLFDDLNANETAYLDAVAQGWDEFGRRNRNYTETLQQTYASDALLLQALLNAGAGEAFAAVRAVIIEIDPPASYAEGHERLLSYLDEAVELDTVIAEAAGSGDVVGFEVANYGLALAAARFSLDAPPSLVSVIADPADVAAPQSLPGGQFGEDLWHALGRFRSLALHQPIESGVFPIVSDENLAAAIAATMPIAITLTEEAMSEIAGLESPDEFRTGHDRLVVYLDELLTLRKSVLRAARIGDLEALRTYGELGGFAAERAETGLWCDALDDLAGDPIEPITATFFRPFAVATLAQLCPTT
ncbi:MAG: hypothetical protein ACR2PK_04170, partial [Acidimicrobiales bacterium]